MYFSYLQGFYHPECPTRRNFLLRLVNLELQFLPQGVLVPAVHHGFMDVEQDGIDIFGFVENLHVMGEAYAKKIVPVDFGRHRRPVLQREGVNLNIGGNILCISHLQRPKSGHPLF